MRAQFRVGRNGLPEAPPDIREEVELWARERGRTAKIHFVPYGGWFVRLELRPNDPRMRAFQEGRAPEPPTEDVFLHVFRQDYDPKRHPAIPALIPKPGSAQQTVPLDIYQLGRSGVREFLEKGDTWSGRGLYSSHEDRMRKVGEANRESARKLREHYRDQAGRRARDTRRQRLKIPFIRMGVDIVKGVLKRG